MHWPNWTRIPSGFWDNRAFEALFADAAGPQVVKWSGRSGRRVKRGALLFTSRGHGTGFAGPQAQPPPRGAESYAKRANVGATAVAPGRPKQGQPPRGAATDTKCGSVGAYGLMSHPKLAIITQLVKYQRIRLFAEAPVDHQNDDFQVIERDRVTRCRHGPVDHDLAHMRGQHAG